MRLVLHSFVHLHENLWFVHDQEVYQPSTAPNVLEKKKGGRYARRRYQAHDGKALSSFI